MQICVYVCVCLSIFMYTTCAGTCVGQKRAFDPLELDLQVAMSHHVHTEPTEPKSPARARVQTRESSLHTLYPFFSQFLKYSVM